jgi:integrase
LRDSAIVTLLATYGVQIRRLRLDHLDWENSRIHFPPAKGGRPIEQYLTPKAGNQIADYIQHARPQSAEPQLFLTLHQPFRSLPSASHLSAIIRRRIKKLGIELPADLPLGSHGFRHALATRMIGRIPFKEIVDILGHRDPSVHLFMENLISLRLQKPLFHGQEVQCEVADYFYKPTGKQNGGISRI